MLYKEHFFHSRLNNNKTHSLGPEVLCSHSEAVLLDGTARVTASGVHGVVETPEEVILIGMGEDTLRVLLGLIPSTTP